MEKALKIDPEFAALIPAPDAEELKWLEESIKKEGCTDPLIVWNGTIIDGHNRYNICTRLGIPFSYQEKEDLSDRNEVKAWIIERQLSRRNLTKYQKSKLALKYEPLLKEQAKERQGARNDLHQDAEESDEKGNAEPNFLENSTKSSAAWNTRDKACATEIAKAYNKGRGSGRIESFVVV